MRRARGVQLDAIAGRQKHNLALGTLSAKLPDGGGHLLGAQRQLLAHVQRRGRVIQSQERKPPH